MSLENRAASKYQGLRMKGDALKGVMDISFTSEEEESEYYYYTVKAEAKS